MRRRSIGSHRRVAPRRRRHLTLALALGVATLTPFALGAPAHGTTAQEDLAAKTVQAQKLEGQIQSNYDKADALDEQLLTARNAIADAQTKIASAQRGLQRAQANTDALKGRLRARAAKLYMGAGNTDPFQIDATDVRELGSRAQYSEAAAQQDNNLLDQLRVSEEQLSIQRHDLEKQQADAQSRQHQADLARKSLDKVTKNQEQLLSSVKGEMANLVQKVQDEKAAAEQAAARARFARAVQNVSQGTGTTSGGGGGSNLGGGGGGGGGDTGVAPGPVPAPSSGAAAAIAYAQAQLGKPYEYAAAGPGSFDCSGLTMMAWAAGGVSLPHQSGLQWDMLPKVPISQLQPGDLVFFGDSGPTNHHVGIVVAPGTMIEAPHTGAVVRYASYYRSDLISTGGRP
jgi:cell wall-associated NlpC family hydrolase